MNKKQSIFEFSFPFFAHFPTQQLHSEQQILFGTNRHSYFLHKNSLKPSNMLIIAASKLNTQCKHFREHVGRFKGPTISDNEADSVCSKLASTTRIKERNIKFFLTFELMQKRGFRY